MTRVSIVTPSFNQASFLQETIESVLSQEHPDVEYIVMDGGSTDGSQELIERYASRIAYWESKKDQGQAHAINKGWQRATGEIVAYLNSDDQYEPGAIQRVVQHFDSNAETDFVYGVCNSLMPSGEIRKYDPPAFDAERLVDANYIPQPTVFFRRRVLDKIGYMNEEFRYCLDYEYWLRAATAGMRFVKLPGGAIACFRFWLGAKSSDNSATWVTECVRAQEQAYHALSQQPPDAAYLQARALVGVSYGFAVSGNPRLARQGLTTAVRSSPRVALGQKFWRVAIRCIWP